MFLHKPKPIFLRSCKVGKPVVVDVLNGYNGTVLAYGQTVLPAILVGKTWTEYDRMQKCSGIQHFTRLAQSEAASLPERHTACMAQLSTVCCDCDS